MARITLLRPPAVASRRGVSVPTVPPLSVACLAAVLREDGHEVSLIDALGEGLGRVGPTANPAFVAQGLSVEDIVARIDPATQAVGVSCMFTLAWPHVHDIILAVSRRFPGLPILLGGEHATAAWRHALDTCPPVTAVALGEGEETIREFAEWLDGKRELSSIDSLAHRGLADPGVVPRRARLRDPDLLPWPAWDLAPLAAYFRQGAPYGVGAGRSIPVVPTRGCPYQCTFCSSPQMWTTRYVMRTPSRVVDEIEHYVRVYGVENVDFMDLTAIVRKDWILEFCREMIRRGVRVSWQLPSGTRSEALDAEVLAALHASGCRYLTYAPESGSPDTLAAIKKRVKLDRMTGSLRAAVRTGITVKCNFIIGFPDETRWDILRTLAFVMKTAIVGVEDAPIMLFTPYPGSELFETLRRRGRLGPMDAAYFESLACFLDLSVSSDYCERVGPRELSFYRLAGLAGFYALSYLSRPRRLARTLRNLIRGRGESVLEQRLLDILQRRRLAAGAV